MTTTTVIKLGRQWHLGPELDSGGFGLIYEATAEDGSAAVIKLVPKSPGAARELLFEKLAGQNIVPILDSGEWEDNYVIVMPRAERSLRKHLEDAGGKLPQDEAVPILADIAEALASLEDSVVHRDLKPGNILLYQDHWCLADFGIARYAEATTETDTRKYSMTAPYAAPEQWRGERATHATDIYALGITAYQMLNGDLPFRGADFREQHLNEAPPDLLGCSGPLASLVSECLYKVPTARPTAANVLARIRSVGKPLSSAAARLQEVQRAEVQRRSQESAVRSAGQSKDEQRRELLQIGKKSLTKILGDLQGRVLEAAPATIVAHGGAALHLELGSGNLHVDPVQLAPSDCLAAFDYAAPFDVIGYAVIVARKPRDRYDYEGRAHSLWFCDAHEEGVFRWFELAFMISPSIPERYTIDPFSLPPTDEYAGSAFTPVIDVRQLAWKPIPFDQGDEEQFIERWIGWFAGAADGSLSHPTRMPEDSGGKFRPAVHKPRRG